MSNQYIHGLNYKVFMGIFTAITFVAMFWLVYYSIKVMRMYKTKSPILLMFLAMLFFSTAAHFALGINEIVQRPSHNGTKGDGTCSYNIFNWMSILFYALTILVNLFNWVFQSFKIKETKTGETTNVVWFWIAFILLLAVHLGGYIFYVVYYGMIGDDKRRKAEVIFVAFLGTSGLIITLGFGVFGGYFYRTLRTLYPSIAEKFKFRILLTVIAVGMSLLVRGVLVLVTRGIHNFDFIWLKNSFEYGGWFYPIYTFLYYTCLTMIPTIIQISMLRFILANSISNELINEPSNEKFWQQIDDDLINRTSRQLTEENR